MVNAITLETRVHREPAENGYRGKAKVLSSGTVTPLLVPALAVRLDDLALDQDYTQ